MSSTDPAVPGPAKTTAETETPKPNDSRASPSLADYVLTADRLSMVSWGDGSAPSMPAMDDEELDYQRELVSTTTSVKSSLYHFVEENGRTYHRYKSGKYMLPNDEQEQARLDLQHATFLLTTHGKLSLAPIASPKRVLDIATGTGIWAIEFAVQYPDAQVYGSDLSPIQPDFLPENCHFELDDAEEEWAYTEPFDYIHARAIVTCFREPLFVVRQAFAHLRPGGYLEYQDFHFPLRFATPPPEGSAIVRWGKLISEGAASIGRPWTNSKNYPRLMAEAGFENVTERAFYWPTNPWPRGAYYKMLGAYVQENILNGLEGLSLRLLGQMGWKAEDCRALLADVRRELVDPKMQSYVFV